MGLADLHLHTTHSWDGTATVAAVLKTAAARGLNVVAITDHDQMAGAYEALDLAPAYALEVVPGVEVSTAEGHVLALYVQHPIPAGRPLRETLQRIGEAGGIAVAAHPGAFGMESLAPYQIRSVRREPDLARVLVGLETLNGSLLFRWRSSLVALPLAQALGMAQVGNSDAHTLALIGSGVTRCVGRTAADLRRGLECSFTQALLAQPTAAVAVAADWLPRYLLRRAGWVAANPVSDGPVRLGHWPNRLGEATQIWTSSDWRPGLAGSGQLGTQWTIHQTTTSNIRTLARSTSAVRSDSCKGCTVCSARPTHGRSSRSAAAKDLSWTIW